MTRKKLQRFEEIRTFPHCICPKEEPERSMSEFLGERPFIIELGCGSGAYTLALARAYPEHTVVGMDIKGARIWFGAKDALDEGLTNVRFIRGQAELLASYFPAHSVSDIWITFPDPYLQERRAKKRLSSERFMKVFRELLVEGGNVHLKTDSIPLYEFTKEEWGRIGVTIRENYDNVYTNADVPEILTGIQTTYEKAHLKEGRRITYLRGGW